jgi:hypothetical protein
LAGFDALADEFVEDAHFFHDVAQAVDTFLVVKIGAAGKLLDPGAGDHEDRTLFSDLFGHLPLIGFVGDGQNRNAVGCWGGVGFLGSLGAGGLDSVFDGK